MSEVAMAAGEQTRRNRLVVLLAVHSGITDAVGFVALGGAFTSVMTGNMVLFGLALTRYDGGLLLRTGAAILSYALGCAVGARLTMRSDGPPAWPSSVNRVLRLQLVVTLAFAVGWQLSGQGRGPAVQLALLAANAVQLGLQSSAVQRFGVSGLSTTYLTGTLTTTVVHLATGRGVRGVGLSLRLLAGLVTGAAMGGAVATRAPHLVPLLPLICLGAALGLALLWWPAAADPSAPAR